MHPRPDIQDLEDADLKVVNAARDWLIAVNSGRDIKRAQDELANEVEAYNTIFEARYGSRV